MQSSETTSLITIYTVSYTQIRSLALIRLYTLIIVSISQSVRTQSDATQVLYDLKDQSQIGISRLTIKYIRVIGPFSITSIYSTRQSEEYVRLLYPSSQIASIPQYIGQAASNISQATPLQLLIQLQLNQSILVSLITRSLRYLYYLQSR